MSDELKPVRCGCGGEAWTDYIIGEPSEGVGWFVCCKNCDIQTPAEYPTEAEAIEAWNTAMGTNTRKLLEVLVHDATDTNVGSKERTAKVRDKKDDPMVDEWHQGRCMNCGKQVRRRNNYCSRCGSRLDWGE